MLCVWAWVPAPRPQTVCTASMSRWQRHLCLGDSNCGDGDPGDNYWADWGSESSWWGDPLCMHVYILSLVDLHFPWRGKQGEAVGVYVYVLAVCVSVLVVRCLWCVCIVYLCSLCKCATGNMRSASLLIVSGGWSCCSIISLWLPHATGFFLPFTSTVFKSGKVYCDSWICSEEKTKYSK